MATTAQRAVTRLHWPIPPATHRQVQNFVNLGAFYTQNNPRGSWAYLEDGSVFSQTFGTHTYDDMLTQLKLARDFTKHPIDELRASRAHEPRRKFLFIQRFHPLKYEFDMYVRTALSGQGIWDEKFQVGRINRHGQASFHGPKAIRLSRANDELYEALRTFQGTLIGDTLHPNLFLGNGLLLSPPEHFNPPYSRIFLPLERQGSRKSGEVQRESRVTPEESIIPSPDPSKVVLPLEKQVSKKLEKSQRGSEVGLEDTIISSPASSTPRSRHWDTQRAKQEVSSLYTGKTEVRVRSKDNINPQSRNPTSKFGASAASLEATNLSLREQNIRLQEKMLRLRQRELRHSSALPSAKAAPRRRIPSSTRPRPRPSSTTLADIIAASDEGSTSRNFGGPFSPSEPDARARIHLLNRRKSGR